MRKIIGIVPPLTRMPFTEPVPVVEVTVSPVIVFASTVSIVPPVIDTPYTAGAVVPDALSPEMVFPITFKKFPAPPEFVTVMPVTEDEAPEEDRVLTVFVCTTPPVELEPKLIPVMEPPLVIAFTELPVTTLSNGLR